MSGKAIPGPVTVKIYHGSVLVASKKYTDASKGLWAFEDRGPGWFVRPLRRMARGVLLPAAPGSDT